MITLLTDPQVQEPAPGTPSEEPVARHLLPDTAVVASDGRLSVGGIDVCDLADRYGTPLFVYDEAHLRARCREAVAAFGPGVAYATKAFLCKAMARLCSEEGMLLDVATGGEMAVALAAGVEPGRLVLHGNNKSYEELSHALRVGVGRIVVDSFDEIDLLARLVADGAPSPKALSIRATPGVEAHTHEFLTTGIEDSKFGFSIASGAARQAINALQHLPSMSLDGVHAHIGSQVFLLEAYEKEVELLAKLVDDHGLSELCVGGGLGVAYLNAETAPSISDWAREVHSACRSAGVGASVKITAEPGRSIVATAGLTCYRIGTKKTLPGIRNYIAVDGGMSDNPRPVLYGSGYEAFLARGARAARPYRARVVGKHCETGDVVVSDARLPSDVAVGDVLVTPVTGAYGFSMASNYNRVPRPAVVFVADGSARVVVRRESTDDLLRLEP